VAQVREFASLRVFGLYSGSPQQGRLIKYISRVLVTYVECMVKVAVNFTASEMASKLHFYCHKEIIKKPKVMHFQFLLCFPGWRCKVFRRQPILFGSCGRGNTGSGLFATGAVPADSFWLVLSRSLPHMSPPHSPSFVLVRADHKGVYKFKMDVQIR
jgi:hypothetical protein